MKKMIILSLIYTIVMLFLCDCTKTIKVETTLENLPTIDIQTYFEDVKLKQVDLEKCEGFELCLSKDNAENLYFNIKTLKEHIKYVKSVYTCDINTYKDIINKQNNK